MVDVQGCVEMCTPYPLGNYFSFFFIKPKRILQLVVLLRF